MYDKKIMGHKKAGLEPAPTIQKFQSLYNRKKRITVYAFSMVEVMITMVIVSTCLVLTLRVFSVCARTVSSASMETRCIKIFKEKLNSIYIKSIEEDGFYVSKTLENIKVDDISFDFTMETIDWEEEGEEDFRTETEEETEEDYGKKISDLLEINCNIVWGEKKRGKFMEIKGIFPAKGVRSEYI